jgi:hypothetical protein
MRAGAIALLFALLAGCAGGGQRGVVERSYRRPEVDQIPLKKLDLVVVAAGPPRIAEERFAVRGFDPPELEQPVLVGAEDPATRDALIEALAKKLRAGGFEVELVHGGVGPVPTSSTATTAASPQKARKLSGEKLQDILQSSTADAVLVVRVVPVDEVTIDEGTGTRVETTALGRETVRDYRPVRHEGRLLVGQAFLFDRSSKLRLWTKQAPDFPDDGRLTPKHPFLAYGYVATTGSAPRGSELAALAASRFTEAMLAGFPTAKTGSEAARRSFDQIDPEIERTRQAFFDVGHLILEIGLGHGSETSALSLQLDGEPLPDLDSGAITPNGLFRLVPRLSYLSAGGAIFIASFPLSWAPSSFGVTLHRDNPRPDLSDPDDRTARLSVNGVKSGGIELQVGRYLPLAERFAFVPRGGGFAEIWSIDAEPSDVATDRTHFRFGGVIGGDLWLRSSGSTFGRAGIDGRVGLDAAGGVFVGLGLSLGVGLLL